MDDLIGRAERLLADATGEPVRLTVVADLPSPHDLVRCRAEGAGRVVVKRVTTTEFTEERSGVSGRARNEIEALRSLGPVAGPWPRLLAAGQGLLVLEDLGDVPTVLDVLRADDAESAAACFPAIGKALAALHTAGAAAPPAPPRSDSTYDVRSARAELEDCWDVLHLAPPAGFWGEVAALEDRIHGPGPWRTLIHADAGPQNFLWTGERARLVDFEFATAGHALLDVVSARLGFPHSADARTVPLPNVEALERAYREAAGPDGDFDAALADACAHWALVRWAALWGRCFRDPGAGGDEMRLQAFTVYRRFVATAEDSGHVDPIADAVDDYTWALERRFPALVETPPYPALG